MNSTVEAPASAAPASLWEDFIDIYGSPSAVFARRSDGRFGVVLLILTLAMTGLFYVSQAALASAFEAEFARAMEGASAAGAQVSSEQLEQMRSMGGIFATVAVLVTFPIGVFLIGLVLWLAAKIFDSVATFAMAVMVATYAQFPRLLQSAASIAQGLFLDPNSLSAVSIGPARFFDPNVTSPLVMGLLSRLDLFVLWSTVLLAIGLHVVGRVGKREAYLVAALVWVVATAPALLSVLRQ